MATDTDGEPYNPPEPFGQCGTMPEGQAGWLIECLAHDVSLTRDSEIVHRIQDESLVEELGGGACCAGCPSDSWIHDDCVDFCVSFFCEEARQWHNASNSETCGAPCDFDLEDCLHSHGEDSFQRLSRVWWLGAWIYNEYSIRVNCEGVDFVVFHTDVLDPFDGHQCLDTTDLELCVPEDPGAPILPRFATRSDAGTTGTFSWEFGSNVGDTRGPDVDVKRRFRDSCGLAQFELTA